MNKKIFILFLVVLSTLNKINSQVIYNAYANVSSISGTTFNVNNVNEANHTFSVGQQVAIIQMQDNVIGSNTTNVVSFGDIANAQSAGLYEIITITSLTRSSGTLTSLTFSTGLNNTYNVNSNSRVQVVTFRRLSSAAFTTTANITGAAWNGTVGGVIALEVGTDFNVAHNISADGIGFREVPPPLILALCHVQHRVIRFIEPMITNKVLKAKAFTVLRAQHLIIAVVKY